METQTRATSKRSQILRAASEVVIKHGAAHMTLDSVAQEAGVSKGGLLYHFPSKEALIAGMVTEYIVQFEARIDRALAADTSTAPGRWLRAYVRTSFEEDTVDQSLIAAGLAAISNDPTLMEPVRRQYVLWHQRSQEDGIDPVTALLVMQATDGVWFAELLGVQVLEPQRRQELMQRLLNLIHTPTTRIP